MMGFCFGVGTFGGALGLFLGGMSIGKTGSFFSALALISAAAVVGIILIACFKNNQPAAAGELTGGVVPNELQ